MYFRELRVEWVGVWVMHLESNMEEVQVFMDAGLLGSVAVESSTASQLWPTLSDAVMTSASHNQSKQKAACVSAANICGKMELKDKCT